MNYRFLLLRTILKCTHPGVTFTLLRGAVIHVHLTERCSPSDPRLLFQWRFDQYFRCGCELHNVVSRVFRNTLASQSDQIPEIVVLLTTDDLFDLFLFEKDEQLLFILILDLSGFRLFILDRFLFFYFLRLNFVNLLEFLHARCQTDMVIVI